MVSVAAGQIPISWSVPGNVEVIKAAIGEVEPGTLLVLPEAVISGYDDTLSGLDDLDPQELAEAYRCVADAATARGVHVVCGSLLHEVGQWWNAGMYFAPGQKWWTYRKINLAMHERGLLSAGSQLTTVDMELPIGRVRTGVQLCREIRFPEQWHCLARAGAQLLLYLTYAANVADPSQHCPTMIVSPRGEVLEEANPDATVIRHQIDLTAVRDGYLKQQRHDVVSLEYHESP